MISLDADTEKRLAELAALQNISVEQLIANFANDVNAPLRACIQKGIQQLENGQYISLSNKQEMDAHFKSLRDRAFSSFNAKDN